MHYMAHQSIEASWEDLKHDTHLELQDFMQHPISFCAEITCAIMHMHQAICQPDAPEFINAMIKKINVHVENTLGTDQA